MMILGVIFETPKMTHFSHFLTPFWPFFDPFFPTFLLSHLVFGFIFESSIFVQFLFRFWNSDVFSIFYHFLSLFSLHIREYLENDILPVFEYTPKMAIFWRFLTFFDHFRGHFWPPFYHFCKENTSFFSFLAYFSHAQKKLHFLHFLCCIIFETPKMSLFYPFFHFFCTFLPPFCHFQPFSRGLLENRV